MAQEFTINSEVIESKINSLLPSQGGMGAGVDFSASTMIVPIIDLTEAASGAGLRQDLQRSLSHGDATVFDVANTTTTVISTTGYWRVIGTASNLQNASRVNSTSIILSDGTTDKIIWALNAYQDSTTAIFAVPFDLNVFLSAGDTLKVSSNSAQAIIIGSVRQIASIDGVLINPS